MDNECVPDEEPEATDASRSEGRLIADRYRMRTRIGGGAMGSVWSGVDELLRRPVAIKAVRLPPGMPEQEAAEVRERTLREARAIAVVSHPNVVTLYDIARDAGEPFVVMELVPSRSLATILYEHGPLNDAQLATVTEAMASALETAHRAEIVHRDVKPGNVLLAEDGRIKLSDFGISRNLAEPTLTRTGIMLGTPAYIAPEVAAGDPATAAADLWGLGATLFAAAEGHPPYDSEDNPLATVTSVVRGPVPRPTKEGPIGEVISGLMVKDPQHRIPLPQVRERIAPLRPDPGTDPFEGFLSGETPTVRTPKPKAPNEDESRLRESEWRGVDTGSEKEDDSPPLASEPGPLPFTPREPRPQPASARRSAWRVLLLGFAALMVFVLAAGGGFGVTRIVAGRPLLPSPVETAGAPQVGDGVPKLVPHVSKAPHEADGGSESIRYTLPVPKGWTKFQGYSEGPPPHLNIHFASRDSRVELVLQRFGGYYARDYTTAGYLNLLRSKYSGPPARRDLHIDRSSDNAAPNNSRMVIYTTSYTGGSANAGGDYRSYARLMPRGDDLWVVRATAPASDADVARKLFESVVGEFKLLP